MPDARTVHFGFELPLDLRRRARSKAAQEGTFLGTVLVEFLEQYVGEMAREQAS